MDKRERFTKLVMKLNNVLRPKLIKAEIGSPEWHELGDMYKLIADEAYALEKEMSEDEIMKVNEDLNRMYYDYEENHRIKEFKEKLFADKPKLLDKR